MSSWPWVVIYHHWSVLSCKNTIRLPLVAALSVYHRAKCQVKHKNTTNIVTMADGCPPVTSSVQPPQDSDSASEKTVVAELCFHCELWIWSLRISHICIWSPGLFCFVDPSVPPHGFPVTLSSLPSLSPSSYIDSSTGQSYLADSAGDCADHVDQEINCQLKTVPPEQMREETNNQWISHETNSNFACWMGLSELDVLLGAAYPLPAPHIRLIISRAAYCVVASGDVMWWWWCVHM